MSVELIAAIKEAVINGAAGDAERLTREAAEAGAEALMVLNDGLMAGAQEVGKRFEAGEYFLPELMLAGRALKAAMDVISPVLEEQQIDAGRGDTGVVVAATIQTDIHDIGKNMVASMLTASGFDVTNLGVDVPVKDIIAKAQDLDADVIVCSSLLTTSMPFIRDLVERLEAMGERDRFLVMVGGAAVTPEWAAHIGADGTASNAMDAVTEAKRLISQKRAGS